MSRYTLTHEDLVIIQDDVRTLSNLAYPKEACGFIFINAPVPGSGVYAQSVDNVAEWPYAQFRIRDADAQWALGTGRCVGVWHSHCSDPAVPSELDQELAPDGMYFLIYAVQDEDLAVFLKDEDGQLALQSMVMPS